MDQLSWIACKRSIRDLSQKRSPSPWTRPANGDERAPDAGSRSSSPSPHFQHQFEGHQMSRMPPPGEHHVPPPGAHGVYDHAWRPPYPPPAYDNHAAETRRPSAISQGSLPQQGYPVMPNRELPQLPPDGPYGRPNGLSGPPHSVAESNPPPPHASYPPPMNGTSHELSPHSASLDYRSRMGFPPPEPPTNESTPTSGPLPPTTQFISPPSSMPTGTAGPYDPNYYQNHAYGARQRKAARAQQVNYTPTLSFHISFSMTSMYPSYQDMMAVG